MTRGGFLKLGLAGAGTLVLGGATLYELVEQGVLPGKQALDIITGACDVPHPPLQFAAPGPSFSKRFFSHARNREVGYTIAYPPGHKPGDRLPLVVMLHGEGGDHTSGVGGLSPAKALALQVDGAPLRPMAIVAVDGGRGYWNPHPGDDPMGMVVNELIPLCRRLGLGRPPDKIGVLGTSMGGYGAILLRGEVPARLPRRRRDQPCGVDELRGGERHQQRRVRVPGRVRRRRRRHARTRVGRYSSARRLGERRSVPSGSRRAREGAPAGRDRRAVGGLPLRLVLPPANAAVARVPLSSPRDVTALGEGCAVVARVDGGCPRPRGRGLTVGAIWADRYSLVACERALPSSERCGSPAGRLLYPVCLITAAAVGISYIDMRPALQRVYIAWHG